MLVEIVRRRARHLVHLREHDVMRGVWSARDAAGQLLSVLPSEISFVLPGRRYAFRDARAVLEAAETRDPGDLENAWRQLRVGSPPSGLSAADAAGAMYGRSDATAVYAAHLLLADDRTFFARVRSPVAARDPRYRPRTEEQVVSSLRRFRAAPAHSPVPRAFFSAALAALSRPPSDKPTSQSWARGPHGQVVAALEAFALLRASLPQQSVALHILSSLGLDPAPSGAAALLEGLGAWRLNEDIFAKRAGASPSFPAKVLAEAEEAPFLPDPDADIRRDLRHLPVITIDSADTGEEARPTHLP